MKPLRFLPDVPTGAHIWGDVGVNIRAVAFYEAVEKFDCEFEFLTFEKQLSWGVVPMVVSITPSLKIGASGKVKLDVVGAEGKAGFEYNVQVGPGVEPIASGKAVFEANPLTPQLSVAGEVTSSLDVALFIGPGVVSKSPVGVAAGLRGTITPLKGSAVGTTTIGVPGVNSCTTVSYGGAWKAEAVASVWWPGSDGPKEKAIEIPGESKEWSYFGTHGTSRRTAMIPTGHTSGLGLAPLQIRGRTIPTRRF